MLRFVRLGVVDGVNTAVLLRVVDHRRCVIPSLASVGIGGLANTSPTRFSWTPPPLQHAPAPNPLVHALAQLLVTTRASKSGTSH